MLKPLQGKLTYANVVATLALFIAIGGASAFAASQLGKNTVGPKQLKKNAVTTAKIKNEAVSAGKVKKGTLTGTQINVSTLGTVPSAMSAQSVGGKSADQIEQSSKLRCPGGTALVAGSCFEVSERPVATFEGAVSTCGMANRSLPSVGELAAYILTLPEETEGWAGSQFFNAGQFYASLVNGDKNHGIETGIGELESKRPYRCSTPPTN